MPATPLENAEQRMQQRWYDLVMAEQQGASTQVLERMYNAYIKAVDEYNRLVATPQVHSAPAHAQQEKNNVPLNRRHQRKAS
jgi:hypothetical protein